MDIQFNATEHDQSGWCDNVNDWSQFTYEMNDNKIKWEGIESGNDKTKSNTGKPFLPGGPIKPCELEKNKIKIKNEKKW